MGSLTNPHFSNPHFKDTYRRCAKDVLVRNSAGHQDLDTVNIVVAAGKGR